MTLLPIIERELRLRARQGATYWWRCAVAGMATLVAIQTTLVYAGMVGTASVGQVTFSALAWLGFILACVSSLATADCISNERRDGTLSLLFLTKLKGYEVVLGKLTGAGLAAACALVAFLPTLALALLAGGVTFTTVMRTALALVNALFVSVAA